MSPAPLVSEHAASASPQRHVSKWEPPLSAAVPAKVAAKARAWQPLNLTAVFDNLDEVLGEQRPAVDDVDEPCERLRGNLMQLCNIAVADPQFPPSTEVLCLVEQARSLRNEEMPGDYWRGLGLPRRLAWTTTELVERLIATRQIKDVD
ncbi:DUF6415 family natural product biosynthesis protein [Streptomyces sp. NPDC002889]|uniref:DUF6415 family natural product biosynthesis protein n=1 Tax=Streptomyces sp. NPDC002889 TaxID=3364669 RepID=UPI00367EA8B7